MGAWAICNSVSVRISGRSAGNTIHPPCELQVACTAAAMLSPIPEWPLSSRCHGRPLLRTASNVVCKTVRPCRSACNLWVVPPEAKKRSPLPEARTKMVGANSLGNGATRQRWHRRCQRQRVFDLHDLCHDRHCNFGRGTRTDVYAHRAMQAVE